MLKLYIITYSIQQSSLQYVSGFCNLIIFHIMMRQLPSPSPLLVRLFFCIPVHPSCRYAEGALLGILKRSFQ